MHGLKSKEESEYREGFILKLKKAFQPYFYRYVPDFILSHFQNMRGNPKLDENVLAFRVCMIVRMNEIFQQDSRVC